MKWISWTALLCGYCLIQAAAASEQAAPAADEGLPADLLESIRARTGDPLQGTRYLQGAFDLNGDGHPELILHLAGPMVCGTGGCPTLIYTPEGVQHRLVSSIAVTRPPIRAAAASTNGWRNLIVQIAGGGGPSGDVELLFDGGTYPENPTVPGPRARPAKLAGSQVLIEAFNKLEDAEPLVENASDLDPALDPK